MRTIASSHLAHFDDMRRALLFCLALAAAPFAAQTAEVPADSPVTAATALEAWHNFKAAPSAQLKQAPIFLKFMQGGAVHTVLNSKLLFWMYEDFPPAVQAVLYAAYMGGNLESQLVTRKQGDDPEAGMNAALDAYATLKQEQPTLDIERLDKLTQARRDGRLSAALEELGQGRP